MRVARKISVIFSLLLPVAAGMLPWLPGTATAKGGPRVLVVLSSDSSPYLSARDAIVEALGADQVLSVSLPANGSVDIPNGVDVVAAVGGKALLNTYPDRLKVVGLLAPGVMAAKQTHVMVHMMASPAYLISSIKQIQPEIRSLGILWYSKAIQGDVLALQKAASNMDVRVIAERLSDPMEVPGHLRKLYGQIDALFIPPDPSILNADNTAIVTEFSKSSKIPVYMPAGVLVQDGTLASISPSYKDMGRKAGVVISNMMVGLSTSLDVYPDKAEIVISKSAAKRLGLSESMLNIADTVAP